MKIILSIIMAIVCSYLAIVTLDIDKAKKFKFFYSPEKSEDYKEVTLKHNKILLGSILVFVIAFCTTMRIFSGVSNVLNICKMLTALFVLTGSACFDYREQRIPNIFPLVLSVSGMLFLIVGLITKQDGAISYMVSSAFATFGCMIGLIIVSVLTNKGIGAGDVKLMGALAITGGVYLICGVLFFSVFLCAIVAVVLLLSKKKTLKEVIPFGPFIYMGYIVSIFTSIY